MKNPHFDEGRLLWSDDYSGQYEPPGAGYQGEFERQWKVALSGRPDYFANPGASTEDVYIEDRVYEWTGRHPQGGGFRDASMGSRVLDRPLDPALIRGKRCIDVCCGLGRWTRTMQALGAASVTSIDISESALASTRRYNDDVRRVDLMTLPQQHPELMGQYDFANFWGVAMCTHDPKRAFENAASTVKAGGAIYLMVYADVGMHGTKLVNEQRKLFHSLSTEGERFALVDRIASRAWDKRFGLEANARNALRRIMGRTPSSKVGVLDMLEPFYNWVIALATIYHWMGRAGFQRVVHLNDKEAKPCAYHVLGLDRQVPTRER